MVIVILLCLCGSVGEEKTSPNSKEDKASKKHEHAGNMVKKTDNAREKSQSVSPKPERTELASGHDGKDAKERNVKKEMLAKQELETKEKQVIVEEIAIKKETENQVHAAALQSVEQRTSDKQAGLSACNECSLYYKCSKLIH